MSTLFNLDSLYNTYNLNDDKILGLFLSTLNSNIEERVENYIDKVEIETLICLYNNLRPLLNSSQVDGYIYGYRSEKGLNEEFDLLRFNKSMALNIELKYKLPKGGYEKVEYQMQRHEHLLKNCSDKVLVYTYIKDIDKLFKLENNAMVEVSFDDLKYNISEEYIDYNPLENVDISSIIISPYSEPERFIESKYFLNENQKDMAQKLLKTNSKRNVLIGGAGTGKSLVLFDLAKKYTEQNKKVILIFCAKLNNSSELSRLFDFDIIPISTLRDYKGNYSNYFSDYDVIMIDEAQRLYEQQFKELITLNDITVIFSTDEKQTLHRTEISLNIQQKLIDDPDTQEFHLTDRIRNNPELSSFIRKFLKLNEKGVKPFKYRNVDIVYFPDEISAVKFMNYKKENHDYTIIQLTEYTTKQNNVTKRPKFAVNSENVHSVIGMEYDNILIPIDKYFYYDSEYKLNSSYSEYYPYDHHNSIFEALTRVKRKILIVIIDNKEFLSTMYHLLDWWKSHSLKNNNSNKK